MSASEPDVQPVTPARPSAAKIVAAFLLPLFFVIAFPLAYVSATHAPTPHDLRLAVVGPDQVVGKIASSLDRTPEFAVPVQTDVAADARSSVEQRQTDGAIKVAVRDAGGTSTKQQAEGSGEASASPSTAAPAAAAGQNGAADQASAPQFTVTTYVGSGGGRGTAATVEATGADIAKQLGTTSKIVDVAPLGAKDAIGSDLFYLLVYSSLGGYLAIIVLTQVIPRSPLPHRFLAAGIAAIAAPLIVFGLSSIFVGDYGASFGTIAALLGVNAVYVFTVASLAILLQQFLGNAATFGVMAFVVFLNFPSAGGATPAALLPGFWQGVHSFYFGAGAFESFRSLVYFGGNEFGRWFLQLIAWTGGLVLATLVVELIKANRRQRLEIDSLTHHTHRHLRAEPSQRIASADRTPESITTGSEATAE